MLDTYSNTSQTVTTDSPIVFNINRVLTGCTVTHSAGSTSISLNKPGIYMIHFNGDAAEGGTAGDITVQLFVNGVLYPGAEATANSLLITDIVNLDFETLVVVSPQFCNCGNSVTLTFIDTGVDAVFSNVEVIVTKIC